MEIIKYNLILKSLLVFLFTRSFSFISGEDEDIDPKFLGGPLGEGGERF